MIGEPLILPILDEGRIGNMGGEVLVGGRFSSEIVLGLHFNCCHLLRGLLLLLLLLVILVRRELVLILILTDLLLYSNL